jgi:hypothetical protein
MTERKICLLIICAYVVIKLQDFALRPTLDFEPNKINTRTIFEIISKVKENVL